MENVPMLHNTTQNKPLYLGLPVMLLNIVVMGPIIWFMNQTDELVIGQFIINLI